ncbi:MAG: hypothetical protein V2I36_09080 [Desulfopila sp.]|nr:hypothetical protein [Desulfopila sp.]
MVRGKKLFASCLQWNLLTFLPKLKPSFTVLYLQVEKFIGIHFGTTGKKDLLIWVALNDYEHGQKSFYL